MVVAQGGAQRPGPESSNLHAAGAYGTQAMVWCLTGLQLAALLGCAVAMAVRKACGWDYIKPMLAAAALRLFGCADGLGLGVNNARTHQRAQLHFVMAGSSARWLRG